MLTRGIVAAVVSPGIRLTFMCSAVGCMLCNVMNLRPLYWPAVCAHCIATCRAGLHIDNDALLIAVQLVLRPKEALSSRNSLLETFLAQQQEKEQTTPRRATNGEAGPADGKVSSHEPNEQAVLVEIPTLACELPHVMLSVPPTAFLRGEVAQLSL